MTMQRTKVVATSDVQSLAKQPRERSTRRADAHRDGSKSVLYRPEKESALLCPRF
jgi:hypothetical protein